MAHFVISQNAKWGHAGFYIDCHRMTVPENILLQKSTVSSLSLKTATESLLRTVCGSEFQTARTEHRKARFANVVVLKG